MVTVQKLQISPGTATPEEILAVGPSPDYIFEPELAEAPKLARYIPGTEIEHIGEVPQDLAIEHCILDHDGTITVLREGWERVMEPMMVRAILGAEFENASGALFAEVTRKVRLLIDRTTGIQTLMQMKGLVDLVRQSGLLFPRARFLTATATSAFLQRRPNGVDQDGASPAWQAANWFRRIFKSRIPSCC